MNVAPLGEMSSLACKTRQLGINTTQRKQIRKVSDRGIGVIVAWKEKVISFSVMAGVEVLNLVLIESDPLRLRFFCLVVRVGVRVLRIQVKPAGFLGKRRISLVQVHRRCR